VLALPAGIRCLRVHFCRDRAEGFLASRFTPQVVAALLAIALGCRPRTTAAIDPLRISVFDNDGTLWTEQPVYTQLQFALDRVKELAPKHPEWKREQPFKAVLEGDMKTLIAGGETGLMKILAATHSGMTTEEFQQIAQHWISTAESPTFHKPYTELVYQPMLVLLQYLRANDF
jgi:hypothetical protein